MGSKSGIHLPELLFPAQAEFNNAVQAAYTGEVKRNEPPLARDTPVNTLHLLSADFTAWAVRSFPEKTVLHKISPQMRRSRPKAASFTSLGAAMVFVLRKNIGKSAKNLTDFAAGVMVSLSPFFTDQFKVVCYLSFFLKS